MIEETKKQNKQANLICEIIDIFLAYNFRDSMITI